MKSVPGMPEQLVEPLKKLHKDNAIRNVKLFSELKKILAAFNQDGIEPTLLKGSYLAPVIYGNLADRVLRDIDILVNIENIEQSQSVLEALGYTQPEDKRMTFASSEDKAAFFSMYKHLYPFQKNGVWLEIHTTIVNKNDPEIDIKTLTDRAIEISIFNQKVKIFKPEDFLFHLCLHLAYQDKFTNGLQALVDISNLYKHHYSDMDIDATITMAKRFNCINGILLTLDLCEMLTGIEFNAPGYRSLSRSIPDSLVNTAIEQMFHQNITFTYHDMHAASIQQKCKIMFTRVFLTPEERDYRYGTQKTLIGKFNAFVKHIIYLTRNHLLPNLFTTSQKGKQGNLMQRQTRLRDWMNAG